ncbi:unnamed protein product [Protopolystoma xenopodis]|uniref:Uncharacterized protein n=1 Tax=Protopolystoma xenopodis TaxID=117903 RepID=A0A3S5A8L0_9PLAT|nr:unnamed protein product [Protopolystoma xenopodis]
MIACSDDVDHMTDLFNGIEGGCLGNSVSMNVPVKPIDSWSRGIGRRLPSASKANRQLVKRNSPSSSGGTDLRILASA